MCPYYNDIFYTLTYVCMYLMHVFLYDDVGNIELHRHRCLGLIDY